jgi:hypothetical protein
MKRRKGRSVHRKPRVDGSELDPAVINDKMRRFYGQPTTAEKKAMVEARERLLAEDARFDRKLMRRIAALQHLNEVWHVGGIG